MRSVLLFLIVLTATHDASAFDRGKALVVFRVVDETNKPVEGAEVRCSAWWPGTAWALPQGSRKFEGVTDDSGVARVSITAYHDMGCRFSKPGHYDTRFKYVFRDKAKPPLVGGRWQPWGRRESVVLKRVIKPIPMYVKAVEEPLPQLGKPIGYDMEKGDWVAPHGRGVVADLVFEATGEYRSHFDLDAHMRLTFSNPGDGVVSYSVPVQNEAPSGSQLVSAHDAPLEGYESRYVFTKRIRPRREGRVNASPRFGMNFYFRVRTQIADDGKIEAAWYGKMYGDLRCKFQGSEQIHVYFTYYLNPNGTRNVEFDTKRNLFKRKRRSYVVYRP